jgi:hypothetical protein
MSERQRASHIADRGSATPLIVGMMFCLLFLGAGLTAAGSAVLGKQRIQHLCDGAAATAADTAAVSGGSDDAATTAARDYLAVRDTRIGAFAHVNAAEVHLACTGETPITFGVLFGAPTVHVDVEAVGRPHYTVN